MSLLIRNYIFVITLLLLGTNIFTHESKHKSKKSKTSKSENKNKQPTTSSIPQRQPMRINNDLQVRGNITSSKILAISMNITGQSIIANSTESQIIKAKKVGVDKIVTESISSSNVK